MTTHRAEGALQKNGFLKNPGIIAAKPTTVNMETRTLVYEHDRRHKPVRRIGGQKNGFCVVADCGRMEL